ncbi:hypothetical protein TrLO_g12287 [Triparma laevis f. longispina]|uniref:Uncharacterized protein n=1 Tax=Triparma laevis f. longispina TaxID=1714387 RepID=A0A9W7FQM9_9STRA|nr:hypothetical protein TrLO_g12287 [Triparma laevis f. longispina]
MKLNGFTDEEAAHLKQDQHDTCAEMLTIASNYGKDIGSVRNQRSRIPISLALEHHSLTGETIKMVAGSSYKAVVSPCTVEFRMYHS